MGYLRCTSCDGVYELQKNESADEFQSCSCGGELEYYDYTERKRRFKPKKQEKKPRSSTDNFIIRILMLLFVLWIFYNIVAGVGMGIFKAIDKVDSTTGFYLLIGFIIISIILIIVLIVIIYKIINVKEKHYLICKTCGSSYELQKGESPDDYEACQCGGELEYSLSPK
jgi:hypothetical protein